MKIQLMIIVFASLLPPRLLAQRNDTLLAIREFMQVCNAYKQIPLHLDLEYNNTSNFVLEGEEARSIAAEFYILPKMSYIRFGEMEQIIGDSLALIISNKGQRMILYPNAQPVMDQMKAIMGIQLQDSSVIKLSKSYTSEVQRPLENVSVIILQSRALLYATPYYKETLEAFFEPETKMPVKITTIRRSLVPLPEDDSAYVGSKYSNTLVIIRGNRRYFLKADTSTYIYKKIEHNFKNDPPRISDRIMKNSYGEYLPVKGYERYILRKNF